MSRWVVGKTKGLVGLGSESYTGLCGVRTLIWETGAELAAPRGGGWVGGWVGGG